MRHHPCVHVPGTPCARQVDTLYDTHSCNVELAAAIKAAVSIPVEVLGVSPSSGYELMHEADFPALRVGNRIVVPKEKFQQWVERHTAGGTL